jgi:hypothetical protein
MTHRLAYPNTIRFAITPFGSAKKQPLNHDQAIKRAKIQLTGKGDIFVFYNQPMNGMD